MMQKVHQNPTLPFSGLTRTQPCLKGESMSKVGCRRNEFQGLRERWLGVCRQVSDLFHVARWAFFSALKIKAFQNQNGNSSFVHSKVKMFFKCQKQISISCMKVNVGLKVRLNIGGHLLALIKSVNETQ